MTEIINSPFLWFALSVFSYEIGLIINRKFKTPILNPLLIAVIIMGTLLISTGISIETYNSAGSIINMFLLPATVALAIPIYRQLDLLKKNIVPIIAGAFVGSITSILSVFVLCKLLKVDTAIMVSLLPKSVTTPIGVEISSSLGGIPSVTILAIIFTGLVGAVFLPTFLKVFHIQDSMITGIAIGTSSHAVGTSRAIELGETEGAMSGLAIGIAGILTVLICTVLSIFL